MDRFAFIEKLEELSGVGVTYFSVRFDGAESNEFEKFVNNFSGDKGIEEEFSDLLGWLEKLKEYGAREQFFRSEEKAQALPPYVRYLDFKYKRDLRLYCCRISDKAVFLFNGAIKTANPVQNCPYALPKFREANEIVQAIDQKFKNKELQLTADEELIVKDEELTL